MATHAVLYNPETRQAVYVHYEGYPGYMMPTLTNHYQTREAVDALFAYTKKGDLRELVETLADCEVYDDGEPMFDRPFNALAAARRASCDFLYTWDGGGWTMKQVF